MRSKPKLPVVGYFDRSRATSISEQYSEQAKQPTAKLPNRLLGKEKYA
jgi:hypothetical protein